MGASSYAPARPRLGRQPCGLRRRWPVRRGKQARQGWAAELEPLRVATKVDGGACAATCARSGPPLQEVLSRRQGGDAVIEPWSAPMS